MSNKSKTIFEDLKGSNQYFGESIEYWRSKEYSIEENELYQLINYLMNDDVFRWLELISSELLTNIKNEKVFIKVITNLIPKIRNDLAQGPFINMLISIAHNDLKFSKILYQKILDHENEDVGNYAGLILGGICIEDRNCLMNYLFKSLETDSSRVKVAKIKALRITFEKEENLANYKTEIFKLINFVSNPKEDVKVRIEAIFLNFDFSRFDKEACFKNLMELVKSESESVIKFYIVDQLWLKGLNDIGKEFKIINVCSSEFDKQVLGRLLYYLAKNGHKNPEITFKIIKKLIKNNLYFELREIDYTLNEIGKNDYNSFILKFEEWLRDEKELKYKKIIIPRLIEELSRYKKDD